jgi:hypothetical protein
MCAHRGPLSPMTGVDAHLLKCLLLRGTVRQPVSCAKGLQLANSLIEGTVSQAHLIGWKQNHMGVNFERTAAATLGKKYWENICDWNAIDIEHKKAFKFDSKRDDWCTKENFATMYVDIYKTMVRADVAEELHEPVFQDRKGNTVSEHDPTRYGRNTKFKLTHPRPVIFVYEVVENTSQKQDGHIGGHKLIVARGTRSQERSSYSDFHVTILGFTAVSGEPVIYAVIVATKRLTATKDSGFNPLSTAMDEPGTLAENSGEEKYKWGNERLFPMGPRCIFHGKEVPTFVCCTENGFITISLLATMIKIIDDLGVFPHNELLPGPFLLLYGHVSRFNLPFLEYINNPRHYWWTCFGTTHGTNKWQVGDPAQHNGDQHGDE